MTPQWWIARGDGNCLDGSTGGEHLRLNIYDSTMVDSQRCWQLSRWKYRWVNILDLIFMTPQWWIARGAGNCLRWKYQWPGEMRELESSSRSEPVRVMMSTGQNEF
ncbi:hypothetical protein E3N88_42470 [Mikania micrantha]|uniref:Uncharacterized protein n=1 Tax=Mikania micrantha TaxID=192012 RepID=A0A5N6LHR0_9ASTR|nr:hypothetical protein E3N88_42470 [Mikania micrantha]